METTKEKLHEEAARHKVETAEKKERNRQS